MNKSELAKEINKVWLYAKAIGIEQEFSIPTGLTPSDNFLKKAHDNSTTYEDLYLEGLKGQYNILLSDYSYLQFGLGKQDGVRFAYYPNPFIGASKEAVAQLSEMREFVTEDVITFEEFLHSVSEIRFSQHPPLIRYEYSKSQYVNLIHPASHFHLGFHAENRWPIRRFLTPTAFSLIVFKYFYPEFWRTAPSLQIGPQKKSFEKIFSSAKVDCRILPDEEFSEDERGQFFFG